MNVCPWASRSHSAHIGQEVEVYYPWHPYHGRRVRAHYSEQRAGGRVVHVEDKPGIVTVLPEWMLDASICASMQLGMPRVSVDCLRDLHRLLLVRGFRRSSLGAAPVAIAVENQDEEVIKDAQGRGASAAQAAPDQHCLRVERVSRLVVRSADEGRSAAVPSSDARGGRRARGERR